ncbi:MAG: hypothetical protein WCE62_13680 [Polyangiales bacterium]
MHADGTESWARGGARIAIPILLLLSAVCFARFYSHFYPVQQWLFWRYAVYWVACAFWSIGCLSAGYALVRRLRGTPLPFAESLCLSFAAGVVLFYLAMNILGALHGLRGAAFFLLPLLMIATGARPLWRYCRRYVRHARFWAPKRRAPSMLSLAIWIFGLAVLAMLYFTMLTPDNVQFDARWKHLALAEQYAHLGFMPRFGEGWTVATNPHLASMLYTWAFLLPGAGLFDRVELAAHMELTCFVWTLATIPPVVRLLVPGARASASWVARLLFPGVLLYDSSIAAGADHIAALFALPIFVLMIRSVPSLAPGRLALLGLMMAGAAMPKLTAGMLLIPGPALVITAVIVWRAVREQRVSWKGPAAAGAVALGATAFFWLRNWIWYGDPLYPSLHQYLSLRPWSQDAATLFEWGYKDHQFWRPSRDWRGVKETLSALVTFSFIPHDYRQYHRDVPVFGSLYTLLLLCLLFLRRAKRIWLLTILTQFALFAWFWVHHQDRYLQTLMPWIAAVTAALIIRVWRTGWGSRLMLGALIATQIVIGGDVYFIQTHAMIRAPIKRVNDLLSSGFERRYEQRFNVFPTWTKVRDALPQDAHVLLHDNHEHLGLSRRTTSDWGGWQFGISYGRLGSPAEVWDLYRDLGVTHLVWRPQVSKGWDSVAGDLVFFDFAVRHAHDARTVGSHRVASMPEARPPDTPYGDVLYLGCGNTYASGLYRLSQMTTPVFGPERKSFPAPAVPADLENVDPLLEQTAFAVLDPKCASRVRGKLRSAGFLLVAMRKQLKVKTKVNLELYVRH